MVESVALASSINYSVYVNVTERVGVTPKAKLSAFDRLGIVVVVLLGTCIGLEIALASDFRLTLALALLFPGLLIGLGAALCGMDFRVGRWRVHLRRSKRGRLRTSPVRMGSNVERPGVWHPEMAGQPCR
jgi:hypothetical protein